MKEVRLLFRIVLLAMVFALGTVACKDGDDADPTPTAVAEATTSDADTPPDSGDAGAPTEGPAETEPPDESIATPEFEGSRDPVVLSGDDGSGAQLTDVRVARHEGFDRVVFEFGGALPSANIAYVSPPAIACGSGLPVDLAGDALLEVRMTPAAAHDDAGNATLRVHELTPGLPAILAVVSTCDFEGEVTWVVGLISEGDFVAVTLADPYRIVIDVEHP